MRTSPAAGRPSATAIEHMRPPIDRPPSTSAAGSILARFDEGGGLLDDAGDQLRRPVRRLAGPPCGTGSRRGRPAAGATAFSMATGSSGCGRYPRRA